MNIKSLKSLAERLEKATGPDRELDRAIDRATAKVIVPEVVCRFYTGSIDHAAALCERVLPGCEIGFYYFGHRTPRFAKADIGQIGGPHAEDVKGATPALAICLAIVNALIAKETPA
jgi:hypothetical protein